MNESKVKNVAFKLDEDTHRKLRHQALDHGVTFKDYAKDILTQQANKDSEK